MSREVSSPRFSIIIPAYNIAEYIDGSINAIRSQVFRDFECIVVNDGSTDNTRSVAEEAINGDARFKIVSQKNGGLSNARNTGYKHINGEYVLFLDGDDLFEATLLSKIDKRLAATDADIVIYNSDGLNNKTGVYSRIPNITTTNDLVTSGKTFTALDLKDSIFNTFYNSVWTKAFRRSLLDENGLKFNDDLKRIEDLPFTNAAFVVAKSITFVDEILLHYRYNTEGSNTANNYKYNLDVIYSATQLRNFLKDRDLLKTYQRSFDNAIVNDCEYYMWWVAPYEQGKETFGAIKKMLRDFGIDKRDKDYFYRQGYYDVKAAIANGTYEGYLRYLLANDRKTKQFVADESDLRVVEIERLNSIVSDKDREVAEITEREHAIQFEYDRIANSKSYKIGNVIAKPVRIVKDAVRKPREQ